MPDSDQAPLGSDLRGLAPCGARHIVAVTGGRGGVGASITATNLAVYLAQLGRKVTLVDADPTGAQLHSMLGVSLDQRVAAAEGDGAEESLELVSTPVPGLRL